MLMALARIIEERVERVTKLTRLHLGKAEADVT
jgi:hypothetical protein